MPKRDIVKETMHGLEAIIAAKGIPRQTRLDAIRQYEKVLIAQTGITLIILDEIGHVIHHRRITDAQRIKELKALEATFVGGCRKSMRETGVRFSEKAFREMFRGYVRQHTHLKNFGIQIPRPPMGRGARIQRQPMGSNRTAERTVRAARPIQPRRPGPSQRRKTLPIRPRKPGPIPRTKPRLI